VTDPKKSLAQAVVNEKIADEPPPCVLHGWTLLPGNRISADVCEDHPYLGTCRDVLTGTIVYLDRKIGIAIGKRTTYILRDEKKP
jgi:hypothetical protein